MALGIRDRIRKRIDLKKNPNPKPYAGDTDGILKYPLKIRLILPVMYFRIHLESYNLRLILRAVFC